MKDRIFYSYEKAIKNSFKYKSSTLLVEKQPLTERNAVNI